jgi:hypothetical protein
MAWYCCMSGVDGSVIEEKWVISCSGDGFALAKD